MTLNPHTKLFLDVLPPVIFFIGFKWLDFYAATALLLILTLGVLAFRYAVERHVALSPLIIAIMVTVMGGLTLWLHDEWFFKIKPTLIYLTFAAILLGGQAFGRNLLKPLLGDALQLTQKGWRLLSLRWGLFFVLLAVLNEIVRRNFSTGAWVNFKVFGCLGLTMLFMLLQAGLIQRESQPKPDGKDEPVRNPD